MPREAGSVGRFRSSTRLCQEVRSSRLKPKSCSILVLVGGLSSLGAASFSAPGFSPSVPTRAAGQNTTNMAEFLLKICRNKATYCDVAVWKPSQLQKSWLSVLTASSPAVASLASMVKLQTNTGVGLRTRAPRTSASGVPPWPGWRYPAWSRQRYGQSYVSVPRSTYRSSGTGRSEEAALFWKRWESNGRRLLADSTDDNAHSLRHILLII